MDIEFVRSRFIKHFDGSTGSVYASPGRINLIGEHTDYNGGFVFPGAIDKGMVAELKINGTDKVRAYSIDLKDYVEFGLNEEDLISYTTSEGSVSLFVGNKNDTLNAYYIISADGGSIYLTETSLADAFSKTIEELTVTEDTESTETVENTETVSENTEE